MDRSILIIEDNPTAIVVLQDALRAEGFKVKAVETGEQALELLSKKNFDAILLDLMLPRVDGFEVCRRIKAGPKTRYIPVIAITAFDVDDVEQRAKEAGVDEILFKPYERNDLIERVKKYIIAKNG